MRLSEIMTSKLRRMHHVSRYSSIPVVNRENVAAHSWDVAFYSLLIGTDMLCNRDYEVNMDSLLAKAVLHDISECLSGDIIRSYKHGSQEMLSATANADQSNLMNLLESLDMGGIGAIFFSHWAKAKDASLEGAIVGFSDMLCVVAYCVEEFRLGNSLIEAVLKELYEKTLCKYHHDHRFYVYMKDIFPRGKWNDPLIYKHDGVI